MKVNPSVRGNSATPGNTEDGRREKEGHEEAVEGVTADDSIGVPMDQDEHVEVSVQVDVYTGDKTAEVDAARAHQAVVGHRQSRRSACFRQVASALYLSPGEDANKQGLVVDNSVGLCRSTLLRNVVNLLCPYRSFSVTFFSTKMRYSLQGLPSFFPKTFNNEWK